MENFELVPRSWQDEKYILYFITASKFTSFLVRKTIASVIIYIQT